MAGGRRVLVVDVDRQRRGDADHADVHPQSGDRARCRAPTSRTRVENATVKPIPTDVFVNFGPLPWANLQVGQFYLPFTLENRISDNTTPFLERSIPVRNIGAPLQRDIGAMFWGESPDHLLYYAVAFLNGDGPNRHQRRHALRGLGARRLASLRDVDDVADEVGADRLLGASELRGPHAGRLRPAQPHDAGRVRLLEADVPGLVQPPDPHHAEHRAVGARRGPVLSRSRTSTSPASSSTRSTTRARPSTATSSRTSPSASATSKATAGTRRPATGSSVTTTSSATRATAVRFTSTSTAPQRQHTQGLQVLAKFEQLRLDVRRQRPRREPRLEDAERRDQRRHAWSSASTTGPRSTCASASTTISTSSPTARP